MTSLQVSLAGTHLYESLFFLSFLLQVDGGSGRENGGSETMTAIAHSDEGSLEGQGSDTGDTQKTRAAIEHLKTKIDKTMDLIRREQNQKECELSVGADTDVQTGNGAENSNNPATCCAGLHAKETGGRWVGGGGGELGSMSLSTIL